MALNVINFKKTKNKALNKIDKRFEEVILNYQAHFISETPKNIIVSFKKRFYKLEKETSKIAEVESLRGRSVSYSLDLDESIVVLAGTKKKRPYIAILNEKNDILFEANSTGLNILYDKKENTLKVVMLKRTHQIQANQIISDMSTEIIDLFFYRIKAKEKTLDIDEKFLQISRESIHKTDLRALDTNAFSSRALDEKAFHDLERALENKHEKSTFIDNQILSELDSQKYGICIYSLNESSIFSKDKIFYLKVEDKVRKIEGRIHSIIPLNGEILVFHKTALKRIDQFYDWFFIRGFLSNIDKSIKLKNSALVNRDIWEFRNKQTKYLILKKIEKDNLKLFLVDRELNKIDIGIKTPYIFSETQDKILKFLESSNELEIIDLEKKPTKVYTIPAEKTGCFAEGLVRILNLGFLVNSADFSRGINLTPPLITDLLSRNLLCGVEQKNKKVYLYFYDFIEDYKFNPIETNLKELNLDINEKVSNERVLEHFFFRAGLVNTQAGLFLIYKPQTEETASFNPNQDREHRIYKIDLRRKQVSRHFHKFIASKSNFRMKRLKRFIIEKELRVKKRTI